MAIETLIPNADGTIGAGWATSGGTYFGDTDDYAGGGSHDSNTTRITGPNAGDGSVFMALTDTAADFDPTLVTLVTVTAAVQRLTTAVGANDLVDLYARVYKSDETTPLTDEVAVCMMPGTSYVEFTVTLTNPDLAASKADWDGACIRLRQDHTVQDTVDTASRLRISAVRVAVTWGAWVQKVMMI